MKICIADAEPLQAANGQNSAKSDLNRLTRSKLKIAQRFLIFSLRISTSGYTVLMKIRAF